MMDNEEVSLLSSSSDVATVQLTNKRATKTRKEVAVPTIRSFPNELGKRKRPLSASSRRPYKRARLSPRTAKMKFGYHDQEQEQQTTMMTTQKPQTTLMNTSTTPSNNVRRGNVVGGTPDARTRTLRGVR